MAKFAGKKSINGGIVKLMVALDQRLQKSLLLLGKKLISSIRLPPLDGGDDVKEGHFAVIAEDDVELKRFVVPLSYLTRPSFLRLLEQAAEEYGFDHGGAVTVPCRPCELERILAEERHGGVGGGRRGDKWRSCSEAAVKSW